MSAFARYPTLWVGSGRLARPIPGGMAPARFAALAAIAGRFAVVPVMLSQHTFANRTRESFPA